MAEKKIVSVVFHKPSLPYQPGDHAAFNAATAYHFVERAKVAEYADEKGVVVDRPIERTISIVGRPRGPEPEGDARAERPRKA